MAVQHKHQQRPRHCALQLIGPSNELAAVYMLPTSSIQTLNEVEKSSDKLLVLSTQE